MDIVAGMPVGMKAMGDITIAVLSASKEFFAEMETANRTLAFSARLVPVTPNDVDLQRRLSEADLVVADMDVLTSLNVPRSKLYQILHSKPTVFFHSPEVIPSYELTRAAYRSGARDLMSMPRRPNLIAEYLSALVPFVPHPV